MSHLDSLLERNKEFAAEQSSAGTLPPSLPAAMPHVKAIIIGCADMRVDPAHVLGIKPVTGFCNLHSAWRKCSAFTLRMIENHRIDYGKLDATETVCDERSL